MRETGYSLERILAEVGPQKDQLRAKVSLLDQTLEAGGPFLFGDSPSLGDFAVFHPLYTLRVTEETAHFLEPFPTVQAWIDRIEAFGHGQFEPMSGDQAVEIARAAEPALPTGVDAGEASGLSSGDLVEIVHENFGCDPVVGAVTSASIHEIVIEREDERAGRVAVHFPREHYVVRVAS